MEIPRTIPTLPDDIRVEAIQTVVPAMVTEPRLIRRIPVPSNFRHEIIKKHLHIILYYQKSSEEESGFIVAGVIKESLNAALSENPILAGRLQPWSENDDELVIISNDSGVRLVQAQKETTLKKFLDSKEKEDAELQLALWKDIDEENPQFSALCYVQVTHFQCDSYTIGITWSLLLADPLLMTSFIKAWADVHNQLLARDGIPRKPLFYLPNFKRPGQPSPITLGSTPCNNYKTIVFNLPSVDPKRLINDSEQRGTCRGLASFCYRKAIRTLDDETSSKFTMIVIHRSGDWKVESRDKEAHSWAETGSEGASIPTSWNDLRTNEVSFHKGNMPARISYHIEGSPNKGLVLIMSPPDEGISGVTISVTVPKQIRENLVR